MDVKESENESEFENELPPEPKEELPEEEKELPEDEGELKASSVKNGLGSGGGSVR